MCEWEEGSIFREICTDNFPPLDLVTLQRKGLFGCVVNESRTIAGTSKQIHLPLSAGLSLAPSIPAMACVKRCKREMFLNVAGCMSIEKSLQVIPVIYPELCVKETLVFLVTAWI